MHHRLRSAPVALTCACLVLLVFASTPAVAQPGDGVPVDQSVRDRIQRSGRARVLVELRLTSGPYVPDAQLDATLRAAQRREIAAARGRVESALAGASGRVVRRFATVPFVAIELGAAALERIERSSAAVRIVEDAIAFPSLADSVPLVQGDQAWATGYDGTGQVIAILDSGVDVNHPFLLGKAVAEACFSSNVLNVSTSVCPNGQEEQTGTGASAPCDLNGCYHGTHVAGIAAGDGASAGVSFSGVAKGAQLITVQVFSRIVDGEACGGSAPCLGAFASDIIAGLEYVYGLRDQHDIAAVNMSLGAGRFRQPCDTEPYKPPIDNLRAAGIASVIASGNSGYPDSLAVPACVSSAVSVASTSNADTLSWFSNVASFLTLLAPGESVGASLPGGGYASLSGTSMAAPHVAGSWAILRQAAPAASVTDIESALTQTGREVSLGFFAGSKPRIRVFEALSSLADIVHPSPAIASLEPSTTFAGTGPLTLGVRGSGFVSSSSVRWNGEERPTVVVSTGLLNATIPAADLASIGTADITVATPGPGGGVSNGVTFTIAPPPQLTVSATAVGPGSNVTVTLVDGPGNATDWLALAAVGAGDTSYLKFTYVGAGVTTRTWTVAMPTTAGAYEFRLFLNNGYARAATSPSVTVDPALNPVPSVTSLSPAWTSAGAGPFSLTITGSGFVASSTVLWNGSSRPTTYVSATQLKADIASGDVAAPGEAQVEVVNPAPGGGKSNAVAHAVRAAPALAVSATTVAPGGTVTLTLTDGYGGAQDWFALAAVGAANTSFLKWTYVGSGVTTRTWTVTMPSSGTYEFRLFLNGYAYTLAATSPAIAIQTSTPPPPEANPVLTVDAASVAGGGSVTVTLANGAGGSTDWLALAAVGASTRSYVQYTYVGAGVTARTWTVAAPLTPGQYEFRLFLNNTYTLAATSPPFTVEASESSPALTVSTETAAPGASVTVTLTGGFGGSKDWIAFAAVGAPNNSYVQYTYVGAGVTTRTWTVTMPSAGEYEFRLFLNNGYTRAATSPKVTVAGSSNPPTLAVSATSVQPGASVTVTLSDGLGGAKDWLAFAKVGSANNSYLQYVYVGAGVANRTWTVTAPATPGEYEFRLFLNNGYTRAATSPTVSVQN